MSNQEIAMMYLQCFCAGDIEGLTPLLAPALRFDGTFHHYHTSTEYLNSLKNDPPGKCSFQILSVTENHDSVAIFYNYEKPDRVIKLAQLFKIKNQLISEILLVFDGRGFA